MTGDEAPGRGEATATRDAVPRGAPVAFRHAPLAEALAAVQAAWEDATERHAPEHGPFVAALEMLAAEARTEGVTVLELLKAVDALAKPSLGGDARLDWARVRMTAGRQLIRAYYADG